MKEIGVIILAGGNSSRLGRPKQLLPFNGQLLVQRITTEALHAEPSCVVVVTGAYAQEVSEALTGTEVQVVYNAKWAEGMGTGIAAGIDYLRKRYNNLRGAVLLVCDQPYVTANLLQQMADLQIQTGNGIIGCAYGDTVGTPALFAARYFSALSDCSGTGGARALLLKHAHDVATLAFPEGIVDIDTEQDYRHFIATFK